MRVIDRRDEEEDKHTTILSQNILKSHRSRRIIRLPRGYETNVIVSDTNENDPTFFKEAMISSDKEKWQEALNQEMESMDSNSIWTLIDLPEGVRIIGCKWI